MGSCTRHTIATILGTVSRSVLVARERFLAAVAWGVAEAFAEERGRGREPGSDGAACSAFGMY